MVASQVIIGASVSEPHIDDFATNFVYNIIIYVYICRTYVRRAENHFLFIFCVSLHHVLI